MGFGKDMNWLLLIVILFIGIFCYRGWSLGIIKSIFLICSTILALVITSICNPIVSNMLCSNEKIVSATSDAVSHTMGIDKEKGKKNTIKNKKEQNKKIEELPLSNHIKKQLVKNNTQKVYSNLLADTFEEYLCKYIAVMIIRVLSFLILYIVVRTGVFILAKMLDIISKLPVIKQMDKAAGLILGGLQSILLIWIGCTVLTLFSGTVIGKEIYECINNSVILTFIYNHNILMMLLTGFMDGIQLELSEKLLQQSAYLNLHVIYPKFI